MSKAGKTAMGESLRQMATAQIVNQLPFSIGTDVFHLSGHPRSGHWRSPKIRPTEFAVPGVNSSAGKKASIAGTSRPSLRLYLRPNAFLENGSRPSMVEPKGSLDAFSRKAYPVILGRREGSICVGRILGDHVWPDLGDRRG